MSNIIDTGLNNRIERVEFIERWPSTRSRANSYSLTQHALTAIPVDSLSTAVRSQIDAALDARLDTFQLIQIAKWNSDCANHSLAEFSDA